MSVSEPLSWQISPNHDAAKKAVVILIAAIAFTFAIVSLHNFLLAIFAILVFIGSTSELWFAFIEWANVKRVVPGKSDVLLSPFAKASRLDNFRGVRLQFASNETEVLAKIATLWRTDERIVGPGTDTRGDGGDPSEARDPSEQV
ncbi:MAG: hypothetical protein K8R88_11790 [Armatimonadetes bacterium]|nr:hypothetical protein [Armatimonadota bacterium]